ncbi:MAG TPA: tRNA lysidine(34) synthetase TilS [Usitatibacter sp.]|nr:tRNA lysidine(34) synthetase TilS [Usitatibacter sp.]
MDLDRHIAARLAAAVPAGVPICVGLSGGLDSVVLLDGLGLVAPARGHALTAVHVHHGLSPNADAWARFCAELCDARGIPLSIERVHVARDAGEGMEAAARARRHAVYAARAEPFVALAHHLDDQAETVLLQVLRGTGLKGLAAMPELRELPGSHVRLFRPLLGVARSALREHAGARALRWIEDESNASLAPDRNYLRHEIAPRLDARFAGWREATARCAGHAAAGSRLADELARLDGVPSAPGAGLALDVRLCAERRANAVRAFLALEGLAMPSRARLAEMTRQLYEARGDARVRVLHDGAMLVRHRGVARVAPRVADAESPGWRVAWHGEDRIDLGAGRGEVRFAPALGAGIAADLGRAGEWHFAPRLGGERLRLSPAGPSRTLKNLLREAAIPEWQRERLPILFRGGRVAWVPGIGVAAEFSCSAGRAGLVPAWSPGAIFPPAG